MTGTADTVGVAGDRIRSIIERVERVEDERDEHETLLEVYLRAMDTPSPAPMAEAA